MSLHSGVIEDSFNSVSFIALFWKPQMVGLYLIVDSLHVMKLDKNFILASLSWQENVCNNEEGGKFVCKRKQQTF